jgi:hypothetical protein
LGYWWESTSIASTTKHHKISQRIWELEEMFSSANRLTAEKAACVQYFNDSNHRAEDERYTVNQTMKQTKNQPLVIEPLQLCTNHKPNIKSAVIEKLDVSVSKIVAIIKKTTFFRSKFSIDSLETHRSVLFTPFSQRKELCVI